MVRPVSTWLGFTELRFLGKTRFFSKRGVKSCATSAAASPTFSRVILKAKKFQALLIEVISRYSDRLKKARNPGGQTVPRELELSIQSWPIITPEIK